MGEDYTELSSFLKNLQSEIDKGMTDNFYLKGDIDIELAVVKTKDVGGKLRILVVEAGGKYEKETVSKIKFQIRQRPSGGTIVVTK